MDLHQYYKENKDEINSSIMEIASDLAVARLVDKHKQPFDAFVKPEDPDSGTRYKASLGTTTILRQPKSRRFTLRFATTSRTETATRCPKRISTTSSTSSTKTRKPWATSS